MATDRFREALASHKAGRLEEAARLYGRVLAFEPRHAGALHLLGTIRLQQGATEEGVALTRRALEARPDFAPAEFNLGSGLQSLGRFEEARQHLARAAALDPGSAAAQLNLSGVLLQLDRPREAFEAARAASAIDPSLPGAYCNAGLALRATGFPTRAEQMFRAALECDPEHAASLHDLGNLLRSLGDRDDEAEALLARALAHSGGIETRVALSLLARDRGDAEAALVQLDAAAAEQPDHALTRLMRGLSGIVALHEDEASPARMRAAHLERVRALEDWVADGGEARLAAMADAFGVVQPFHLPYAGGVDREAQSRYGGLAHRAMAARFGTAAIADPPRPGERVRVGFVSGYFRDHSNWKIPLRGWVEGLDRARFEVFGYHTGEATDAVTERARAACARFVQGPLSTGAWREAIGRDRPHVLIWPETGMDGSAFRLACLRLAPLQCVSWGHPITSGLPTIDFFLSSDAMEPVGAEAHYTERLVRLPGLGFDYEFEDPEPVELSREEFGIASDRILFFSGQSLPKYLPHTDAVFVRIARAVPEAAFVFVEPYRGRRMRLRMRERLGRAFTAAGLDPDWHLFFVDRLPRARFVALAGLADVILDGMDWAGCNSTLECLGTGTPVVTLEGETMRARHGSAILRAIGVPDTIAADPDGYVAIATALARDRQARAGLRIRMREGRQRIAGSCRSADDLGRFLLASFAATQATGI